MFLFLMKKEIKNQKVNFFRIEMSIGPTINLSSALNFDLNTLYNNFVKPDYTISQKNQLMI